jgi:hypothetical protein
VEVAAGPAVPVVKVEGGGLGDVAITLVVVD